MLSKLVCSVSFAALLPFAAAAKADTLVTFEGVINPFMSGPFAGAEDATGKIGVSGKLVLDDSVLATGASSKTFSDGLKSFELIVGDMAYRLFGTGGRIQQTVAANQDFFTIAIGTFSGSQYGSVGDDMAGADLAYMTADMRGWNANGQTGLFDDPAVMLSSPGNVDYLTFLLRFAGGQSAGIYGVTGLQFSPVVAVPEPGTLPLMLASLGLLGFYARRRAGRG